MITVFKLNKNKHLLTFIIDFRYHTTVHLQKLCRTSVDMGIPYTDFSTVGQMDMTLRYRW